MRRLPSYILAGGKSSRFGSDKARAEIQGFPLIQRIAQLLGDSAIDVTVVADGRDKYADLGLRTIADVNPGDGPLMGLMTALKDALERGHEWVFLTSCDLLILRPAWLEDLFAHANPPQSFVAFRGTFWEPLVACYHVSLIPPISQRLRQGQTAMWKFLDASNGIALLLPADWPPRIQANTPGELAAAIAALQS